MISDRPLRACLVSLLLLAGGVAVGCAGPAAKPLSERVAPATAGVLTRLNQEDRRDDYTAATPTDADRKVIASCLDNLPPRLKETLAGEVEGIFLVNNLQDGARTKLITEPRQHNAYWIILDSQALRGKMQNWLELQEQSTFLPGDPHLSSLIECGKDLPAAQYLLLREAARIFYVDAMSLEGSTGAAAGPMPTWVRNFTATAWDGEQPLPEYDFPARKLLSFFGRSGEAKASFDKWEEFYKPLAKTPFASLYGSQTSADDFAEFVAFYHLTAKMGQTYRIHLFHDFPAGETKFAYEPLKTPQAARRVEMMKTFYEGGGK